jgi:hypothetical protein
MRRRLQANVGEDVADPLHKPTTRLDAIGCRAALSVGPLRPVQTL